MKKLFFLLSISLITLLNGCLTPELKPTGYRDRAGAPDRPEAVIQTNKGDIVIQLYHIESPQTCVNFALYVKSGFYNGTIFHRVIKKAIIQGGGMDVDMVKKETREPVAIESDNKIKNIIGSVAMARTSDPNSATSQFFINTANNNSFNYRNEENPGYTVFGRVVRGMDVVKEIERVKTHSVNGYDDVPVEAVEIIKIYFL